MGYRVHKDDDQFKVVEIVNGEVRHIQGKLPENDAKKLAAHLNIGGAFAGWTPDFFSHKIIVQV